jgi:hypothetical protein
MFSRELQLELIEGYQSRHQGAFEINQEWDYASSIDPDSETPLDNRS